MLEHADAYNVVVKPVYVPIIAKFHLEAIGYSCLLQSFRCEFVLPFAQGNAFPAQIRIILGRMQKHAAPSTADINHRSALCQAQFSRDQLVLLFLHFFQ